jgi:outer membrane receptor protein involved in Fe transport
MNLLPTTLLKRVEIVTGGASAAWGSDAVAGVVNLVLDKEFTGFKASIQSGTSAESDGDELRADIAGGMAFADGRGHVLASLNYTDTESIDRADSRSWYRGIKAFPNPAFAPGNGEPERLTLENVGTFFYTDAGIVNVGPLAGTTFAADGSPLAFDYGQRSSSGNLKVGGTPSDFGVGSQLQAEYSQVSGFLRGEYDLTDNANVYAEFNYARTEADSFSVPYLQFFAQTVVRRDNAFLHPATAALMDGVGVPVLPMGRTNLDMGRSNPHNVRELERYVLGSDIQLSDNWSLEAYYQHGVVDSKNEIRNDAIRSRYALAVDAVLDPVSGQIVCRSTLTDPNNGCAPANVFGFGAPSAEAIAYIHDTARQEVRLTQDVAAVAATGDLFDMPAGPVSVAFGAEYRQEKLSTVVNDLSVQPDGSIAPSYFWVGNYQPATGKYDVNELFGEFVLPVFADSAMGESLDLNLALRSTNYSTSGSVETWKAGLTYDIGAGVSMRGTVSRDIRAPNLSEYFAGGTTNSITISDPEQPPGNNSYSVTRTVRGNELLDPEEADTRTIGIVFQPEFAPGLVLSVDYLEIELGDAIGSIAEQDIIDGCFAGRTNFCDLITRDPTSGLITSMLNAPVNFAVEKLSAYDFEGSYAFDAAGGEFSIRTLWTYTKEHFREIDGARDNLLGEFRGGTGPQEWAGLTSFRFEKERYNVSLRHRFVGEGVVDADWTSGVEIDNNKVDSANYLDLSAAYNFEFGEADIEFFGGIENLLNEDPPVNPRFLFPVEGSIGAERGVHDLVGRYFRIGLRANF